MKTKSQIEMDFERAVNQAMELEEISKELSQLASAHVAGAMEMLSFNWKGDNADKFMKNGKLLTGEMLDTADDLIKVAKNIRLTAGIVYNAEKSAMQLGY